jgi:basic amino acid/polyamine antiporter, APA family
MFREGSINRKEELIDDRRRNLGWLDCASLAVGIMLGTGIFAVFPKLAAAHNASVSLILLAWVLGALVALSGAFCFAELSGIFPQSGGDYVFLREAFSRNGRSAVGFLFAWAQILVIRPASLVSLAIVLGINGAVIAGRIHLFFGGDMPAGTAVLVQILTACGALVLFAVISIRGIRVSKWIQHVLTAAKLLCLCLFIAAGLFFGKDLGGNLSPSGLPAGASLSDVFKGVGMALIPIMWVFGGWNEVAYVAGEVKDPARNIPKGLIAGLLGLGSLYLLMNFIYILNLSPAGLAASWTFASDLMGRWFGPGGEVLMAVVLAVSIAGAMNGLTLTGGRMTRAFADDFKYLRPFAALHQKYGTPAPALIFNLALCLVLAALVRCRAEGIEMLLVFTAGPVWVFFALAVGALFILRKRLGLDRIPYKVPFYPLPPLVFLVTCGFMLWGAWEYKPRETLFGIAALPIGLLVYSFLTRKASSR